MNKSDREKKFLVCSDAWRQEIIKSIKISQGYLSRSPEVRVRIAGDTATLAVLGDRDESGERIVFEYQIPLDDALLLMLQAKASVEKIRHSLPDNWTVDEFENGLVLAEVKVSSNPICLGLIIPCWVGSEVTDRSEYQNINIAFGNAN